jgi:arylsulfatase
MMRDDDWKLIMIPGEGGNTYELYDLRTDPLEERDVAAEHPEVVDSLKALLVDWIGEGTAQSTFKDEVDDETMQALKALGYIHEAD